MQSPNFSPVIAFVCAWLLGLVIVPAQAQAASCFCPIPNDVVNAVAVQVTDGKIVFGGAFTTVNGQAHSHVARLLPDGSLDSTFVDPMVDGAVDGLELQGDGKIVIGGSFAHVGAFARNNLARLNTDGSLDTTYDPNVTQTAGFATVYALALQADGKVLLGGHFTTVGATPRSNIARLNTDGSVDTTYNPNSNNNVLGLGLQADGKLLLGGYVNIIGGASHNGIARVNTDGSVDNTFNPSTGAPSEAFVQQADGKLVVGGAFGLVDGVTQYYIARISGSDGSLDATYNPNPNNQVVALSLQPDGKSVIGGYFTTIGSTTRNAIARVNIDGSLDTTYDPNATLFPNTAYVLAMARQADGKLVVGGGFSMIGATILTNIARLYPDGVVDGDRIFENGFE
jgi:uncharacterized delta-60 repeat protein